MAGFIKNLSSPWTLGPRPWSSLYPWFLTHGFSLLLVVQEVDGVISPVLWKQVLLCSMWSCCSWEGRRVEKEDALNLEEQHHRSASATRQNRAYLLKITSKRSSASLFGSAMQVRSQHHVQVEKSDFAGPLWILWMKSWLNSTNLVKFFL
jgi:hypothetical protein